MIKVCETCKAEFKPIASDESVCYRCSPLGVCEFCRSPLDVDELDNGICATCYCKFCSDTV